MKYILSILFLLILFNANATRRYPTKGGDNGVFISTANAGDTIVLTASQNPYSYISMSGKSGTGWGAGKQITIINEGGQVELTAGFDMSGCKYFKVTGSGDNATWYGFYIHGGNVGFSAYGYTWGIKFERAYIYNMSQSAFWIKNELSCDTMLNYPNFHIYDVEVSYIHSVKLGGDGAYVGTTGAGGGRTITCADTTLAGIGSRLANVSVHDCSWDSIGRQALQISGADSGTQYVYNDTALNTGTEFNACECQGGGIYLGSNTSNVFMHDCYVDSTLLQNYVLSGVDTVHFYNNYGNHPGKLFSTTWNGYATNVFVKNPTSTPPRQATFIIENNTLLGHGTASNYNVGVLKIENYTTANVICNSGDYGVSAGVVFSTDCSSDAPPTANAGNDTTVTNPAVIVLNGSYTAGSGTVTSTVWSNTDGCAIDSVDSLHTYATCPDGTHTFTLTVTDDNDLSGNDNKIATVNAAPADTSKTVYLKSNLKYLKLKFNIPASNINYGVFSLSGNIAISIDTAKSIGNLKILRYNYIYDTHNDYKVKLVQDSGFQCAMTFGYYRPQDNPNFQTDTSLYKQKLDSLLSVQSPERIAIENEFANGNVREFAAVKYANILRASTTVAHEHNIKISDGGWIVNNLTFPIMRYASKAGDTATLGKIQRALGYQISDTSNSTIQAVLRYWDTAYVMLKDIPYDESNLHWYELPTTDDYSSQTSQLLPIYVQFLKDRFNKPVITTEFGTHNTNIPLLYSLLKELKNASVDVQIYFAGVGTDGLAKDLHQYYSDWLKYK